MTTMGRGSTGNIISTARKNSIYWNLQVKKVITEINVEIQVTSEVNIEGIT